MGSEKVEWSCNFFGKCKHSGAIVFKSEQYNLVNSNATITFEDWSVQPNLDEVESKKAENSSGAVWVDFDKSVGGRHWLQVSIGVPHDVHQKALTTDFTKDDLIAYIEFPSLTMRSQTSANALLNMARLHFHTRINADCGLFGPDHPE